MGADSQPEEGFEPTTCCLQDSRSNQLSYSGAKQPAYYRNVLRKSQVVAHTGFEPVISALRGRCPGPLDECAAFMAGELGFEPRLADPESAVLPLDYSPPHFT